MGFLDRIAGRFEDLMAGDGESQTRSQHETVDLARDLTARGALEEAAAAFGRAADADSRDVEAWLGLGETLGRLGRFEPARDAFRRALTTPMPPDRRARAHASLGRLYADAGQTGKAVRELRKAVNGLPSDRETLTIFGRTLIAAGEEEGSEWLARAARLAGGETHLLVEAAAAKVKNDPPAAERLLREAKERAPTDATVSAALARHLAVTGDLAGALAEATAATMGAPDDAQAWGALREVHVAAARYPAAIEAARREVACGEPPPFTVWLALALGAEDRAALEEPLRHGDAHDPGYREAREFLDGTLDDTGLADLARMAPQAAARRFLIRALAPPPPPADNLYALLAWAEALAARHPALLPLAVPMARAQEAFDRPLLVAVMGEFNAGKSSFVNALAGAEVAPVGVTPTTATINILRHGPEGGRAIYHDGRAHELRAGAVGSFLGALNDDEAGAIRQVEIFAPVEALRRVEIVDTPGLNSLRVAHEKVARDFLQEADAIVWVFAAGQAAKATEREALALAHAAGKRVLGVLNKVDRASPDEIAAVVRHVETELGELVERVVPLSARAALGGKLRGDAAAVLGSGLPAVEAALESSFFGQARALKRATALSTLTRFLTEARAAMTVAAEATEVAAGPATSVGRQAVAAFEQRLRSTLASERVTLRARLDGVFRSAAREVRDFVRPGAWLFGEHSADPEDENFLRELLDDGAVAASAKTRAEFAKAADGVDQVIGSRATALLDAIDDAVERFRAYARGMIEGASAVFFRVDLPHIRLDLPAIHRALARWTPDPEEVLFRPLERAIDTFVERARAELDDRERTSEIATVMRGEHVLGPLDALSDAITALTQPPPHARQPHDYGAMTS